MNQLLKEIDFSKQLAEDSELKQFIREAAKSVFNEDEDAFKRIKKPIYDEELQNHLILTGLPVITKKEEYQKLPVALKGLIDKKKIPGLLDLELEWDGTKGNGTAYAIFDTGKHAKLAFTKLNQFKFTKQHTINCFTVKEVQDVYNFNTEYKEPTFIPEKDKINYNLKENSLDQFIFRETRKIDVEQGSKIGLKWFDSFEKTTVDALENEVLVSKPVVTKTFFSCKGTYLVVCNDQGFYLYAGDKLRQKAFFKQKGVLDVKFSNDEKYMVSFNGDQTYAKSKQNIIIWAVEHQIKIKVYRATAEQSLESVQFSNDSKKISVVLQNEVHFFDIEDIEIFKKQLKMAEEQLEENNVLKVANVQKVAWLKTSPTLVVMCFDPNFQANLQAITRIFLYNTKTKEESKWKAWGHHIKKGQIIVSDKGDWAAICVKKFVKKNLYHTVVQICNLQKKELEFENIEFPQKIGNVAWDTARGKFAVMVQSVEKSIVAKYAATFFQIISQKREQKLIKIGVIPETLCNRVYISENGTFFALYNIDEKSSERGRFTFGVFTKDLKEKKKTNLEIVKANLTVAYMTFFKVDITGRYVLLGTQKGYQIWNTVGEQIFKDSFSNDIKDVCWRPRTLNALLPEKQAQLNENWKKIKEKHTQLDDRRVNSLKYRRQQQKKIMREKFLEFISKKREWYRPFGIKRKQTLGFDENTVKTRNYEVIEKVQQ